MKIAKDTVVSFSYRLSENGQPIEDSNLDDNILYLHGHNNMFEGIEQALEGQAEGDNITVTLRPEQAYGHRRADGIQRVSIKMLASKKNLKPGNLVVLNTPQGPKQAILVKAGKFNIDIDTNHPLAGKTLTFDINVLEVRAAEEEEISHGHAHGDGGHQH